MAKFIKYGFVQDGPSHVTGLLSGVMFIDILVGKSFNMARTFWNELVRSNCNYLDENSRAPSWVHAGNKDWWALLTGFVIATFEKELTDIRLFGAIKAT